MVYYGYCRGRLTQILCITEYSYLIPSWVLTKLLLGTKSTCWATKNSFPTFCNKTVDFLYCDPWARPLAAETKQSSSLSLKQISISFAQTNKTWSWLNFLVSYQPVRQGRVHLKSPSSNSLKNNFGCITCIWYRDHLIFPIWKGISHERESGGLLVQTFCFRSVEFQILSVFSVVSRHG